jgi:hypothetical protein
MKGRKFGRACSTHERNEREHKTFFRKLIHKQHLSDLSIILQSSNSHKNLQFITGEEQFEQENSFKYLGAIVNTDNAIEEEIKERIVAGNRAFHVHRKLFISKLISQNIKLQNL